MDPADRLPLVTLVVPVRNERARIGACLDSLREQDYPADRLEILVVDGRSNDGTADVVRRCAVDDSRVRLIENPDRTTATGLNRGIEAASGDVIGVISGHSEVHADYVTRTIGALRTSGAWSVGGAIDRQGENEVQRAIGAATGSAIGVGDARHNYAGTPGWVESVFPGTWPRFVFDRVGLFDPAMAYNEDNEFSLRIRRAGGRIWYEPSIRVRYWPRDSFGCLFGQYRSYARGRLAVHRKHGAGIRWRHLLPPLLVAWIAAGWLLSLLHPAGLALWAVSLVGYVAVVTAASIRTARGANPLLVTVAVVTMHVAYGVGILQGMAQSLFAGRRA